MPNLPSRWAWACALLLACEDPESTVLAPDATLLLYNTPAAVAAGTATYVGFTDREGAVRVSTFEHASGAVHAALVHAFGAVDDHASPALAVVRDGEHAGKLLVAAAHHSSTLFVYRSLDRAADAFELICELEGNFTYPRFLWSASGLSLFFRQESGAWEDHSVAAGIWRLSVQDAERCGVPEEIVPAAPGEVLYWATPVASGDDVRLGWSVYRPETNLHTGVFVGDYSLESGALETRELAISALYSQQLVWSVSSTLIAASHFESAFTCCRIGQGVQALYAESDGQVRTVAQTEAMPAIFYPSGFVLHPDGRPELLEHRVTADGASLQRRRATSQGLGRELPSCATTGTVLFGQYVTGGGGDYVYVTSAGEYGWPDFGPTSLHLCRVMGGARGAAKP